MVKKVTLIKTYLYGMDVLLYGDLKRKIWYCDKRVELKKPRWNWNDFLHNINVFIIIKIYLYAKDVEYYED